jgi:dTDP-glucose 4,6-dehydratase
MKVLVTGSAGFIGCAVIHHIVNSTSHSVINVDKLINTQEIYETIP